MSESTFQTIRIRKGKHASPARGACVVELASMLAGEPFSDHPKTVCPVIAGFLRAYNDLLPDRELDELYPYAALVVGSAASPSVRRERARRLLEWARVGRVPLFGRLFGRMPHWDMVALPAVHAALRMDPAQRRTAVADLLHELTAIGGRSDRGIAPVQPGGDEPRGGGVEAGGRPATRL
jgi:hypothetical protein